MKNLLGEYLRQYRIKHNYSQSEFATIIGTDQAYYSLLENGVKNPGIQLIKRISKAMNVSEETLRGLL